jgi:hypothetical protein
MDQACLQGRRFDSSLAVLQARARARACIQAYVAGERPGSTFVLSAASFANRSARRRSVFARVRWVSAWMWAMAALLMRSALLASTSALCPPILRLDIVARGLFVRSLLGEPLRSQPSRFVARGLSCRFILGFGARGSSGRRLLETGFRPFSMMVL